MSSGLVTEICASGFINRRQSTIKIQFHASQAKCHECVILATDVDERQRCINLTRLLWDAFIKLKFHGTIFCVASSWHPPVLPACPCVGVVLRSPRARHARLVADILARCHEDATRKTASVEFKLYHATLYASAVSAVDLRLSLCLSVCLSVTSRSCIETAERIQLPSAFLIMYYRKLGYYIQYNERETLFVCGTWDLCYLSRWCIFVLHLVYSDLDLDLWPFVLNAVGASQYFMT